MLLMATAVPGNAQSLPTHTPSNTDPGLDITTPPPYPPDGAVNKRSQQNSAWRRFDAATSGDLGLNKVQQRRMREIDERYWDRYQGLGPEPWEHPDHRQLHDEREDEIRNTLTPERYNVWSTPTTPLDGEDITPPR